MVISAVVKRFVEENIDVIDHGNWYELFERWYNYSQKSFPDTTEFMELIVLLKVINRDILIMTEEDRKNVIVTATVKTIRAIKLNKSSWRGNGVYLEFLMLDLVSCLGLSDDQIAECIMQGARIEKLKYNSKFKRFLF